MLSAPHIADSRSNVQLVLVVTETYLKHTCTIFEQFLIVLGCWATTQGSKMSKFLNNKYIFY